MERFSYKILQFLYDCLIFLFLKTQAKDFDNSNNHLVLIDQIFYLAICVYFTGSPLWPKENLDPVVVNEGASLILQCNPPPGLPPPVIFWMSSCKYDLLNAYTFPYVSSQ